VTGPLPPPELLALLQPAASTARAAMKAAENLLCDLFIVSLSLSAFCSEWDLRACGPAIASTAGEALFAGTGKLKVGNESSAEEQDEDHERDD
jgi:hypothetical protein